MFHQAIIEFNAWIIAARKNQVELNLNGYNIDELVEIEVNSVQKRYMLADLPEGSKLATVIGEISESFSNYRCKFRGKQELQFFIKFLTKLKDDLCGKKPKYKISFQIPTSNFLSALTHCINTICRYASMFAGLFRTFHDFA